MNSRLNTVKAVPVYLEENDIWCTFIVMRRPNSFIFNYITGEHPLISNRN
ncbi:hypothetical protein HanPSC8_Chr17g0754861 [Helianthus annuus]|nr:hypothetical protein HanPSC8_Chr17g0754861 [Helianthus annuus]